MTLRIEIPPWFGMFGMNDPHGDWIWITSSRSRSASVIQGVGESLGFGSQDATSTHTHTGIMAHVFWNPDFAHWDSLFSSHKPRSTHSFLVHPTQFQLCMPRHCVNPRSRTVRPILDGNNRHETSVGSHVSPSTIRDDSLAVVVCFVFHCKVPCSK